MKTTNNPTFKRFLIGFILFSLMLGVPQVAVAQLKQVAVVPFKINAAKDLSFLRDGIVDMLISRLSWEDKVAVLSREETARMLDSFKAPA